MKIIQKKILEHKKTLNSLNNKHFLSELSKVCKVASKTINQKKKIIFCGNGGSASDSNHLSAELVGMFKKKRKALNSISLTSNSSAITAIANDYGFEQVFARQLEAVGKRGDLLICITTSGKSKNILKVLDVAKKMKIITCLLSSTKAQKYKIISNFKLLVPCISTDTIQEMHILLGHIICDYIERNI
jgi:D-sedoheptulose 7-phosphate isomerase